MREGGLNEEEVEAAATARPNPTQPSSQPVPVQQTPATPVLTGIEAAGQLLAVTGGGLVVVLPPPDRRKPSHVRAAARISSGSTPRSYTLPPGLYPPFIAPPPSTSITFSSFLLDCATIRELTQADLHTDTRTPVGRDRENSRSDRELRGVWSTRKRRRTVAARTQYRGYRGSS